MEDAVPFVDFDTLVRQTQFLEKNTVKAAPKPLRYRPNEGTAVNFHLKGVEQLAYFDLLNEITRTKKIIAATFYDEKLSVHRPEIPSLAEIPEPSAPSPRPAAEAWELPAPAAEAEPSPSREEKKERAPPSLPKSRAAEKPAPPHVPKSAEAEKPRKLVILPAGRIKKQKAAEPPAPLAAEKPAPLSVPSPPSTPASPSALSEESLPRFSVAEQKKLVGQVNNVEDHDLIAYARKNIKWLYDKFSMGAMQPDDFRVKVRETMAMRRGVSEEVLHLHPVKGKQNPFDQLGALSKEESGRRKKKGGM